ncbi:MAG: tryptophan synthase subunit alpha [Gammaproteobacteria bacterium]|nr:tryptophan synthase subunit alpha [Gammaproteobacteria bacterium]
MTDNTDKKSGLEPYLRSRLKEKDILLMTHAVVGYPSLEENWAMLECMAEASVDLVELQLPFSEPIADGPAFIKANQLALEHNIHWNDYFDFFQKASDAFDFPLLFMGYYNSVFTMGEETFCDRLKTAGGDGYIIADLPMEASIELDKKGKQHKLDHIQIMTPVNSDERMQKISDHASGFLYCVARKGVTGKQTSFDETLTEYIQRCRKASNLPLALGFGIKSAEQVNALKTKADIAIIGTACLEVWEQQGKAKYIEFLTTLRK